ncbi:MAG: hypothetical protein DMF73_15860 [Acidobacteria bacterium]|nr:MAG: hypothetical protein DMF73_15860 [Acidobacteriota bacterium]
MAVSPIIGLALIGDFRARARYTLLIGIANSLCRSAILTLNWARNRFSEGDTLSIVGALITKGSPFGLVVAMDTRIDGTARWDL